MACSVLGKAELSLGCRSFSRGVETQREARLFAISGAFVDHTGLGGFVQMGGDLLQRFIGFFFVAGLHQFEIAALRSAQAGFDRDVPRVLTGVTAHPALS
jgi:hypothetical protein